MKTLITQNPYIAKVALLLSLLLITLLTWHPVTASDYKIGIRANRGVDQAIRKWQPTIDHLNQSNPEHNFSIITYTNNSSLNQALSRAEFDFVLTNSASHVEHVQRYKVRPIATLVNTQGQSALTQYGSVIFCRADRTDITQLKDLKGKTFMAVDELGFGGWRAAWYEMSMQKIDPYEDFAKLSFAGGKQQRVITAVLNGEVDAGSVRSNMLERMAQTQEINLDSLRVLNVQKPTNFPFLLSTALYPEWPMAVLPHVPSDITHRVTASLISITPTDTAAIQGKYHGWTAPLDYTNVDNVLKTLRVGHYKYHNDLAYLIGQYWPAITIILIALILAVFTTLHFQRLSRKLATAKHYLVDEIQSRKKAENILHHLALNAIHGQTEEDFLKECVQDLAKLYNTQYAFIGLFQDKRKTQIATKVVWANDQFAPNFVYDLRGTPCQDVLNRNIEIIHSDATKRYPEDKMLVDMGIDSYYGAPLITQDGRTLGLISVMDTKPLTPANWASDLLSVFANRITLELDRLRMERELQDTAEELSYQASHDSLTGLINRREFERRLMHAIEDAHIEHKTHACCYLDLDQFKIVNDANGHIAGDQLLKQLSRQLEQYIRGSDTLARLGGDEFGVLLLDCPQEKAVAIAEELRNAVKEFHFSWENKTFDIGVSTGLVMIDRNSQSIESIFAAADSACYLAKEKGRNRLHVFEPEDEDHVHRAGQLQWASRISSYLKDERFSLFRQNISPATNTDHRLEQFEILLRYHDDNGDINTPADLIIAAERYGLMESIDRWVFDASCQYLHQICTTADKNIMCHINISGLSLLNEEFKDYITAKIKEYHLQYNIFCLEITETSAINNLATAVRFINYFRNLGVRFALDDFGSGMSSFNYLKNLPVDYLKIDGHIVRDASLNKVNLTMLKSIHDIGKAMNIRIIAESVETEALLNVVNEIGVELVQGFYLDMPRPVQEPA